MEFFELGICGPLTKGVGMLAAIGLGLVGTILVIVLVVALLMFFLRRA